MSSGDQGCAPGERNGDHSPYLSLWLLLWAMKQVVLLMMAVSTQMGTKGHMIMN